MSRKSDTLATHPPARPELPMSRHGLATHLPWICRVGRWQMCGKCLAQSESDLWPTWQSFGKSPGQRTRKVATGHRLTHASTILSARYAALSKTDWGKARALVINIEDAVRSLHTGLGVRQGRLPSLLFDSQLGNLWDISRDDQPDIRVAKVIYRLEQVFRTITVARDREAAPVIFNLNPDAETHSLNLEQRLDVLSSRHPGEPGYSRRSMSRITEKLSNYVIASLKLPLPGIPDDDLLAIVRREHALADELSGQIGPREFRDTVRRSYSSPREEATQKFLRLPAFVPTSHTNDLIIAKTSDHGDWICVFSDEGTLRSHCHATPHQPWSGKSARMLGAELVRRVVGRWNSVGILVDPPATRSTERDDAVETLRLSPGELARLAREY